MRFFDVKICGAPKKNVGRTWRGRCGHRLKPRHGAMGPVPARSRSWVAEEKCVGGWESIQKLSNYMCFIFFHIHIYMIVWIICVYIYIYIFTIHVYVYIHRDILWSCYVYIHIIIHIYIHMLHSFYWSMGSRMINDKWKIIYT